MLELDIILEKLADPKDNFAVFSGNFYTSDSALNEIHARQPGAQLVRWFSKQTGLVYLPAGMQALYESIDMHPPIYLQHIFPVTHVMITDKYSVSFEEFTQQAADLLKDIGGLLPFSVQATVFNKDCLFNSFQLNKAISDKLTKDGRILDVKNPWFVLSIVCHDGFAFMGTSTVEQNMSKWSLGKVHYSIKFNRAEYKLLECIAHFDLKLHGGSALDIGAAPGGWTKALVGRGYKVWAIDPARLDDNIEKLDQVIHLRQTAQQFARNNTHLFNIIVNDMVMDCRDSARIMNDFADYLTTYGIAVMTAKLPKSTYNKRLKTAMKILRNKYEILGIRQLPSNKSEVTLVLKRL